MSYLQESSSSKPAASPSSSQSDAPTESKPTVPADAAASEPPKANVWEKRKMEREGQAGEKPSSSSGPLPASNASTSG